MNDQGPPPNRRPQDALDRLDRRIAQGEGILLVVILATMVALSTMQFALRKILDFGFEWADVLARQMVLWLGFIGGALASHQGRHIAVDALCRLLPPKRRALAGALAALVAAGISAIMVRAAYTFVQDERAAENTLVGTLPAWVFACIIPISLSLITFHFLVAARHQLLVAWGRRPSNPTTDESWEHHEASS